MRVLLLSAAALAMLAACDARVGPDNKEAFPGTDPHASPEPSPTGAGASPVAKP